MTVPRGKASCEAIPLDIALGEGLSHRQLGCWGNAVYSTRRGQYDPKDQ